MTTPDYKPAIIAIVSICLLTLSESHAQETTLQWKFEVGDQLSVSMHQQTQIVSQVDRRSRTSSNDMYIWIDWQVIAVDQDQTASIKQTIKRIKLETKTPNEGGEQVTRVDTSDGKAAQGLAAKLVQLIKPLIGGTITIQINGRGVIESVEIPEATMETLRQAPASMQLRQLFTEQGLKEMFGQAALEMPADPMAAGETWETTAQISSELGTFDQVQMFTLEEGGEESALRIITLKTELRETKSSPSGARLESFTGTGRFTYDSSKGLFTESRIDNQMVTTKPYRNMVIKTDVTSMIELTVARQ